MEGDDECSRRIMAKYATLFKRTYFEKLFKEAPDEAKSVLRINFHMHHHIMDIVNMFYPDEFKLVSGIVDEEIACEHPIRFALNGRLLPRYKDGSYPHAMWLDTSFNLAEGKANEQSIKEHGTSRVNAFEIEIIRHLVDQIIVHAEDHPSKKKRVAIIAFYADQRDDILTMLDALLEGRTLHHFDPRVDLEVGTVDSFQGRQQDIVIVSMTATEESTFMREYRRVNVAMSRARAALVVVGSASAFAQVRINAPHRDGEGWWNDNPAGTSPGKKGKRNRPKAVNVYRDMIRYITGIKGFFDANDILRYRIG